jgi:DNA-binding XRE family transcriptional regulator
MSNRLRELRATRRMTQFQLRLETGIHQSKISLIENDWVMPRKDESEAIAKAMGCTVDDIFGTETSEIVDSSL